MKLLATYLNTLPSLKSMQPPAQSQSRWIKTSRGIVRYVERGNPNAKFTVILMPDPPNVIEHMDELITQLEADFRVVAYENLGFGYSKANAKFDFSIQHNSELVLEIIDKLDINRAVVALTCVACLHGLHAARKSNKIVGVVLGQGSSLEESVKWATRVDFKGMIGTPVVGQLALKAAKGKIADIWYKNALPKGADRSEYLATATDSFYKGSRFSLASSLQALKKESISDNKLTAEQDAIVVWGKLDRTHRATQKNAIMNLLPNGEMREVEQCGHFPDLETPEIFAKAIRDVVGLS